MMSTRLSLPIRGLTWLLAVAFTVGTLPAPVAAQEAPPAADEMLPPPGGEEPVPAPSPGEAARERIARLRAARVAAAPADLPESPAAPADEGETASFSAEPSGLADGQQVYQLKLNNATLDELLDRYSDLTGRTMIKTPNINAQFTFKAQSKLTRAEMIQAMDSMLTMNNLSLVPLGERFYRVVQTDKAFTEGMAIQKELPEGGHPESDALVSQLVTLKYLEMEDAVTIVQAMLHGYGKVQRFDRINGLLVTDTSANLKRVYDILEMVDQPTETRVETRIYEIKHAKAADIAARLNELISDSQAEKKEEVAQVAQPPAARRPPSMYRARQPPAAEPAPADTAAALEAALAERGIIQGKVKILSDERTNIIIVISRPANFTFFDKIVAVLDRPVDPEVIVQVVALEYADAEEMASLLNEFIGAAQSEKDAAAPAAAASEGGAAEPRARALEDYVRARAAATDRVRQAAGEAAASKIGQLSPNTKILADKRTNTLMLMGTKGDIAALREIIKEVDIMLAQVLIEAVILEVNLNNVTSYGVNWLQKSMTAYSQKLAGETGVSIRQPVASWGGAFGQQNFAEAAGETITRAFPGAAGLSYFFTFNDLNMDLLLKMVASSGEGRVLATPVILTTDNTEATINSGQQIPIRTGDTTSSGGTFYSDYEYKDVGIILKVKPRINPSRYVTLEITQTADTLGDPVDMGDNRVMYAINKREMTASISVPSRATIVLGGLVQTDYSELGSRVPILGSIPLLGALFRSEEKTRKRTELLVLITPYVLMTPDEARGETARLHAASNVAAEDWYRGWSDSPLAPFSPTKLRELKREEQANRRAQFRTAAGKPPAAPAVALIEPPATMPKPTPDAQDPETFGREVERMMRDQDVPAATGTPPPVLEPSGPLPAPEEPTPTAPFVFDPAAAAVTAPVEEEPAAPRKRKSRRALLGTKVEIQEDKPSMFPAPAPDEEEKGDTP